MTVALYIRVSTEEQATQGFSVDNQRERLIAYCTSQGWDDYRLYVDDGQTGTNIDRPALQRMLAHISDKRVDTVVVYKLDRLSRKQKDVLHLLEDVFDKNGVVFKSVTEPFDTGSSLGKATIGILAVFAQLERDMIVERTTSGRRMRISQGRWSGGRVPFGYRWDKAAQRFQVVPEHAEIVREIFRMHLRGLSYLDISEWFRARVTHPVMLHRDISLLVSRRVYLGELLNGPVAPSEGAHEAIVSAEVFEAAQREKERRTEGSTSRTYLLSGLCKCGLCGSPMIYVRRHSRGYMYLLIACKNQHVRARDRKGESFCRVGYSRARDLEAAVVDYVRKSTLDFGKLRATLEAALQSANHAAPDSDIQARIDTIATRLERWYDAFETGALDAAGLASRVKKLEEEKAQLLARQDAMAVTARPKDNTKVVLDALRLIGETWDFMDDGERHAVLARAVRRILVTGKNQFQVEWVT